MVSNKDRHISSFLFTTQKWNQNKVKLNRAILDCWCHLEAGVGGITFQVKHLHDLTVSHCFYTLCSKGIGHNFTKELKQNKIRYINIKNRGLLCFLFCFGHIVSNIIVKGGVHYLCCSSVTIVGQREGDWDVLAVFLGSTRGVNPEIQSLW